MTSPNIKKIIELNKNDLAFLIGNGINRFSIKDDTMSWNSILVDLWKEYVDINIKEFPVSGITYPEIFDVIDLNRFNDDNLRYDIQKKISARMKEWEYGRAHKSVVNFIKKLNCPLLTTNFDEMLSECIDLKFYKLIKNPFTDFYPWSCYYGDKALTLPTEGFSVWNIHGMIKYPRSIKLGLSHYAGCIERTRGMLHNQHEESLFSGKNVHNWSGYQTWLHIIFNKSLFVFGLDLEVNETFLRYLLIERAKYFKLFPDRKKKAWFVRRKKGKDECEGQDLFLKYLGFEIIEIDNWKEFYNIF